MPLRHLSPELQRKAENDLNENSLQVQDDLKYLRNWIAQQPHLQRIRTEDQWLASFIRGCKFSMERTKDKLDNFYTVRSMLPEFFSNRDPFLPEIQDALKCGSFLPLPKTVTPDGPRIILSLTPPYETHISVVTVIKAALMILEILMNEDDNFVIAGQHGIGDLGCFSYKHLVYANPAIVKKIVHCLQNVYPVRPKGFYTINTPSVFETLFNLTQPLLTTKLRNRLYVYEPKDINSLYEKIPKFVLPREYGGESATVAEITEYWKGKVESYGPWFKEDANYYAEETLRPGKPKTSDEMFGIAGTFRKMDVD